MFYGNNELPSFDNLIDMKTIFACLIFIINVATYAQLENCELARKEYLNKNPDVKKAGIDPWLHYNNYGKKEGRVWISCEDNSKTTKKSDNLYYDDSIKKIENSIQVLNNKIAVLNDSLNSYYTFAGKKIGIALETIETYNSFKSCEVYKIERGYYDKHQKDGRFKIGGNYYFIFGHGTITEDIYFGLDFKNQVFAAILGNRFGYGSYFNDDSIYVSSDIIWNSDTWINQLEYSSGFSEEKYKKSRNEFFTKVTSQLQKNPNLKLLSPEEKSKWLKSLTNLDDNFFIYYDELKILSNELALLNKAKNDYLLFLEAKKIQDTKNELERKENERIAEANKYPGLVKIGSNYWQNQNCRITKYMNGDPITFVSNSNELDAANNKKEGAYCFIDFNSQRDSNYIVYNWYAIMDPRGFGTEDLRIANWSDWKNLISTLEKDKKTFNDLKKTDMWAVNKKYPTSNYYGFNGIPTLYGFPDAYYKQVNFRNSNGMYFWLPDDYVGSYFELEKGKAYQVSFVNDGSSISYTKDTKNSVFPIRLVKGNASYFDGNVVEGQKQGFGKLFVRTDDNSRYDYVNFVNVQSGSVIEGNWINNNIEGKAKITWLDGTSEEALFVKNVHQGTFRIDQNKTQTCIYDGKKFSSHYKKTEGEIELEKTLTKSVVIRAYKIEYYCSSECQLKAEAERIAQEQLRAERARASSNQSDNSNNNTQGSGLSVFVCDDCGKIQTSKNSPYDKSTCPETRWGGIGGSTNNNEDNGDHSYTNIGESGANQFVCSSCKISVMLNQSPKTSGRCGASGSNCCNHNWQKN